MHEVEFRLDGDVLTHAVARRALSDADWTKFDDWVKIYHELAWLPRNQKALRDLGRQIHDWLDGPERWLEKVRETPGAPVIANFAVPARPDQHPRLFLEVPWELAADSTGHLAAEASVMWAPVRRLGPRAEPLPPNSRHRLGVMFMAAAPLGETLLDFEAEESAILRATQAAGLDLVVEDSGNLAELRAAWQGDGSLDALHLSCHGLGGANPFLALEGPGGERDDVDLDKLAGAFAARQPRLLFLSACHTGEGDASVDSLALRLVGVGLPAVLAWADAVNDSDASAFAASFYGHEAHRATELEAAWALARFDLLRPERGKQAPEHWHLARLFLGPRGGGPLAIGRAPRVAAHPDGGRKGVVDARGDRIEVASRFEFVGRRREIQAIRREFRQPQHAGVLIHGLGRQGKSSLAARIMDRHPELTSVVLFQRCDGPSVLAAIRERVTGAGEICERWSNRVDPARQDTYDPQALQHALRELFEGPCSYAGAGKPILLVLDDFEALLDPPVGTGHWRVKSMGAAPLAAIIRAFELGGTDSRLLITSRYAFRLGGDGHDPAMRLLTVQLPETSPANRLKQARQKLLALGHWGPGSFPASINRAIEAARGNAGLQDLLFQAVLADPKAGENAVRALEDYLGGGPLPEQEELRAPLEKLLIERLIEPLTDGERTLLRCAKLFELPVPLPVWEKFASKERLGRPERLLAFGLWERVPDIVDWQTDAAGANAIAAVRLAPFPEEEAKRMLGAALDDLFVAWGGGDRPGKPTATDIELTRLALASGNLDVLAATARFAIRGREQAFDYREAAATASRALAALQDGGRVPETQLLRAAAEVFDHVGDTEGLQRIYAGATELGIDDPSQPSEARLARAQFRMRYGGYLRRIGQPDAALEELRATSSVFEALGDRRERAVTLGDIARIMTAKGEVDAALELHREQVQIFEALGERRERAVTLGEIARIMTAKGEVDAALDLHNEELKTYEALGDRRSRAVTLGDIARIMRDKGEVDAALELHREQMQIFEALGDRRERAVTLGDIARIMTEKGEVDAALELHREQVQIFEALGDRRSRAVTLGDIAGIMTAKGEVDAALELHNEELKTYEALGDRRSRAVTLGEIARIMTAKGEVDAALELHREQVQIFEALGERRSRAVTLGDIARIMTAKGEVDAALELHQEGLEVSRQLGDQDGIAAAGYDIGQIQLGLAVERSDAEAFRVAVEALTESYAILMRIGRLDGICSVGLALGQALAMAGENDEAREVLQRSFDGFRRLGRVREAAQVEEMLRRLT